MGEYRKAGDEFGHSLFEEIDYEQEAANAHRERGEHVRVDRLGDDVVGHCGGAEGCIEA